MTGLRLRRFRVKGTGEFPFDMLRYDACWPDRSEDAMKLTRHLGAGSYPEAREIRLCSYKPPTEGRWRSFLWTCVEDPP